MLFLILLEQIFFVTLAYLFEFSTVNVTLMSKHDTGEFYNSNSKKPFYKLNCLLTNKIKMQLFIEISFSELQFLSFAPFTQFEYYTYIFSVFNFGLRIRMC